MTAPYRLVPLTADLWAAGGRAAYQAGIDTGHASFAATAPPWEDFAEGKPLAHLWAAQRGGRCLGWACVSPSFSRCVYAGVMEESVYVDPAAAGQGVGRALLERLISSTEAGGVWTLEALIFPENAGSVRLHERVGFRLVGTRERMGLMTHGPLAGRWRDVLLLERRSPDVGVGAAAPPVG